MTEEPTANAPENNEAAKPEDQAESPTTAPESTDSPESSPEAKKEESPASNTKPVYDVILGIVVVAALSLAGLFYTLTPKGADALLIDTKIKFNAAKRMYKTWEEADKNKKEGTRKRYLRDAHNEFLAITKLTAKLRTLPDYVDPGTPKFKDKYKEFASIETESATLLATLKENAKDGDIKKKAE